ncbi:MAG: hypothetical protein AB1556_14625 [Bacillota bacterium]
MPVQYKGKEDVTSSAGLLISILARYPEVATINFDPAGRILKFTFIASRVLLPKELSAIKKNVLDSIEVFNLLARKKTKVGSISCRECDHLTILEVQRDIDTLVSEEIALIVQLLRNFLGEHLVTEANEAFLEDDMLLQEEIIEHLLESLKGTTEDRYLFAFREEDRVLVFNK